MDNGSSATFCTKRLLGELGVNEGYLDSVDLTVSTIQGEGKMRCALASGISVCDLDGNNVISLPPLYVIDEVPIERSDVVRTSDLQQWPHYVIWFFLRSMPKLSFY